MMKNKKIPFLPVVLFFLFLNILFIGGSSLFSRWNVDRYVLLIGNGVLFFSSGVSYLVALRGLHSRNPHAFVRSVYGSIMVKFFICIIAALVYIMAYRKEINKPALFACMGLYLLYTFIEISVLTKSLKAKTHAEEKSTA